MTSFIITAFSISIFTLGVYLFRKVWFTKNIGNPYPPGPKGSFVTGNLKDIPKSNAWLTYASWKKKYGDLIHLSVLGEHIVIVNSHEVAVELFEKRGKIYSNRADMPVVEMMGWDYNTVFKQYSEEWRLHRKLYQQFLGPQQATELRPILTAKVHEMLRALLNSPQKFADHYRYLAGATIMKMIYDIDVATENDYYVEMAEASVNDISKAALPGAMLVNTFPIMRYIPAWFPGAHFKRFLQEARVRTEKMITVPFVVAQKNLDPASSIAAQLLEEHRIKGGSSMEEHAIRHVCATSYAAGSDTTVAAMGTFFHAMVRFQDIQKKAQMEIDDVVGNLRLPNYDDRDSLPYVEAIYREVMRWRPVSPIGLPHSTSIDDVYNGYLIPKGALVISNIWAMAHDENVYAKPEEFNPERFFKKNGQLSDDNVDLPFGFGRRICPGKHVANSTVWLTIATVLAAFSIRKAKDENGNEIAVPEEYTDGLISHPFPFKCSITPRNGASTLLVKTD